MAASSYEFDEEYRNKINKKSQCLHARLAMGQLGFLLSLVNLGSNSQLLRDTRQNWVKFL